MQSKFSRVDLKKKLRIGITLLVGIALLGAATWTLKHRLDQKNSERSIHTVLCNTDEIGKNIKKDISVLSVTNGIKLKPFSDKIEALTNHEKSANCMLILTAFNAYIGDYTKAKIYYAGLQSLKGKGIQIDSGFKLQANNLDVYMKNVDNIVKQFKANTQSLTPSQINPKAGRNGQ